MFQENKTTQGVVSFVSLLSELSFALHAKSQQIVKGVTGIWACSQGWGSPVP